jgi:hypothetical protein
VAAGGAASGTADGGYVRRVAGLSRGDTYRLSAAVRATWPVDEAHRCEIGIDPTGQDRDPGAPTISWAVLPARHGAAVPWRSGPVRPEKDVLGVWVRARSRDPKDIIPFAAEFSGIALRRVPTGVPRPAAAR